MRIAYLGYVYESINADIINRGYLYEAVQTPSIVYHGTSSHNIRSILKNGMISIPEKRTYDNHEETSIYSSSRKSLDGSYWTFNVNTASFAAGRATGKFGGDRAIVIAQIKKNLMSGDEDNYHSLINYSIVDVCEALGLPRDEHNSTIELKAYTTVNGYQKIGLLFADYLISYLKSNKSKPRPYDILIELFKSAIDRRFSYIDPYYQSYYKRCIIRYAKEFKDEVIEYDSIEFPKIDKNEAESAFLRSLDRLTSYYPEYSISDDKSGFRNGRVLKDIKFSGSNKIISIITFDRQLGSEYKIVYGTIPQEVRADLAKQGYVEKANDLAN